MPSQYIPSMHPLNTSSQFTPSHTLTRPLIHPLNTHSLALPPRSSMLSLTTSFSRNTLSPQYSPPPTLSLLLNIFSLLPPPPPCLSGHELVRKLLVPPLHHDQTGLQLLRPAAPCPSHRLRHAVFARTGRPNNFILY